MRYENQNYHNERTLFWTGYHKICKYILSPLVINNHPHAGTGTSVIIPIFIATNSRLVKLLSMSFLLNIVKEIITN